MQLQSCIVTVTVTQKYKHKCYNQRAAIKEKQLFTGCVLNYVVRSALNPNNLPSKFNYRQSPTYATSNLRNLKSEKIDNSLKSRRSFPCATGNIVRRSWRKNTAGLQHRRRDGLTAAGQVPECWCSDLNWTPLYIRTQSTICIPNSATCAKLN
jgi:hypothetical protein